MSFQEYLKNEFQLNKFGLSHSEPSLFFVTAWQSSSSPVPMLVIHSFLFLAIIGVISYSKHATISGGFYDFWFIYLTHWGLVMIFLVLASGLVVSLLALNQDKDDDDEDEIRWYVKIFWLLYNIANPMAIIISLLYWTLLHKNTREKNLLLTCLTHGANSVIVLLLLFSSAVPSQILHFYQPCLFGIAWSIFSVIYYTTGGLNPYGEPKIYPVIDWSKPWSTLALGLGAIVLIVAVHWLVVALAALRSYIASKVKEEE